MRGELVIGYKKISQSYISEIELIEPDQSGEAFIKVRAISGPFKYLLNNWHFKTSNDGGCEIDFFIDFSFSSPLLEKLIGGFFNKAVAKMVSAFIKRADEIYQKP